MTLREREMRRHRIRLRRRTSRPFLIDAEDFDFMDDCEMHDWMFGNPSVPGQVS